MGMLPLFKSEVLLIYISAFSQEVVTARHCQNYVCVNAICECRPSSLQPAVDIWVIPVLGIVGGVIGCCVFVRLLIWCCSVCKVREETRLSEELRRNATMPPPALSLHVPSASPINHLMEPPPYTEVGWKLPLYPPPLDEPPAYDNVAMGTLPPLDVSELPRSLTDDHTSTP